MVDNYRVVTNSPYGRKRYVEILVEYLLASRPIIDKHVFWLNTNVEEDLLYLESLVNQYPDFFEVIQLPYIEEFKYTSKNVARFYEYCIDPNTVYCKIDDDIVWFEHKEFENFIRFRINNPQYFLVFANTVNNAINYYIHDKIGALNMHEDFPAVDYSSVSAAWYNYSYAVRHFMCFYNHLKNGTLHLMKFNKWVLTDFERYSINFFSWMGSEFAQFVHCGKDDEKWLSQIKPAEREKPNCIYGGFIAVHYAYYTQRKDLDAQPQILELFQTLSRELKNG
jgi:hypothetical protein